MIPLMHRRRLSTVLVDLCGEDARSLMGALDHAWDAIGISRGDTTQQLAAISALAAGVVEAHDIMRGRSTTAVSTIADMIVRRLN